jgi:Mg-chelatase subunit ChlD
MNEDDQNPHAWIEPELEARVVAWVLGEASAFEVTELERRAAATPELALFKRRIEAAHGLAKAAFLPDRPALRLSPERRRVVLEAIGAGKPAASRKVTALPFPHPGWLSSPWLIRVAACLVLAAVVATFFSISPILRWGQMVAAGREVRFSGQEMPASSASVANQLEGSFASRGVAVAAAPAPTRRIESASAAKVAMLEAPPRQQEAAMLAGGSAISANSEDTLDEAAEPMAMMQAAPENEPVDVMSAPTGGVTSGAKWRNTAVPESADAEESTALAWSSGKNKDFGGFVDYGSSIQMQTAADASEAAKPRPASAPAEKQDVDGLLKEGVAYAQSERYDLATKRAEQALAIDKDNRDARRLAEQVTEARENYAATVTNETRSRMIASVSTNWELPASTVSAGKTEVAAKSPSSARAPAEASEVSARDKAAPRDELDATAQPFSTFSLHVADVSFQLAKDAIARGQMPDPARVRPEEFYNAFDYGDPSPGQGEQVSCRVEQCAHPFLQQRNLVRVAMKVAATGRLASQPLRLTILLDTSGSMEREDRVASVRRALASLASLLGPRDSVTLIGFAREPRLLAEQTPGSEAGKLVEIAARTPSEGGTNLEAALDLAGQLALKQRDPGAQNRIVLLTDGAANLGDADPALLAQKVDALRQRGVAFDACGVVANGLDDEILESLTRKGAGRYYLLEKPGDADAGFAKRLAGALRPAAENVKVQVKFNPARVGKYRLIGFDKHRLKTEDFRNDRVAAAELSAEEAAVAMYQVEPLPDGEGELGEVFVRFRDPATGAMVERSWTLPYDAHAPAFDRASPSMQLAGASALLAERLRGDEAFDLSKLAPIVAALRGQYPNQVRVDEFVRMFDRVAR